MRDINAGMATWPTAVAGDLQRGLFFRGSGPLPFGDKIRPVRDLIDYLLNGTSPVPT